MSWELASVILFGGLTVLMCLGLPVAFAFLIVNAVGAMLFLGGTIGLEQLARNAVVALNNFALTPIPFFILMGEILFHTRIALKAIDAIGQLIERVPGRLAVVAIVAGTVFSAISGSTIATTALLGSVLLPEMLKRGYKPEMGMGPIMAIGGVDMLIPPSALAVLLGGLANISISDLLVAGVIPGLVMSAMFVAYIVIRCWLNPNFAPKEDFVAPTGWAKWKPVIVHVFPLVLIFAVVVSSMIRGWATPTESAAVGAMATIIVAAIYRSITVQTLTKALIGTTLISGAILFILLGATAFSQILSFSGASAGIISMVLKDPLPAFALVILMMLVLLFLGCFIDQVSMMMVTLPFFMPLVQQMNIDPIWFGVLFLICMQLGLLTPPFGLLLFTMKSVAPPEISMKQVYNAATPYVVMGLVVLVLIMLVPELATWLPRAIGSR